MMADDRKFDSEMKKRADADAELKAEIDAERNKESENNPFTDWLHDNRTWLQCKFAEEHEDDFHSYAEKMFAADGER